MRIEPAHVDQIRAASNGRMVLIDSDVGGVAADLQAIDPGLKVRFAENGNPPFFAVYYESEDRRSTYLILSVKAELTASGTWAGLDRRVVDRVREIDAQGRGGYDFAEEIRKQDERARQEQRNRFRERVAPFGERAAHAVRRDLGVKSRAFIGNKYGE